MPRSVAVRELIRVKDEASVDASGMRREFVEGRLSMRREAIR
jgi:hypothetical protein